MLHYAFGGGYGHIVRSLSLLQPLVAAANVDVRLLANSPFIDSVVDFVECMPGVQILRGPNDSPAAAVEFVSRAWSDFEPDCLIVDTFPRGLGGELVPLFKRFPDVPRVLISRTLPQQYVDEYDLVRFVARNYRQVIVPGEVSPFESLDVLRTAPFFVRSADAVRSETGAANVLFVGTGTHQECEELGQLATEVSQFVPEGAVRFIGPDDRVFPLFDQLAGARGVVASAGYNLANEVKALGVPALLFARTRKYDDQTLRANSEFPSVQQAVDFVRSVSNLSARPVPDYENGAVAAACGIMELLRPLSGYGE